LASKKEDPHFFNFSDRCYKTGFILFWGIIVLIPVGFFQIIRKIAYELFYKLHFILVLIFLIMCQMHPHPKINLSIAAPILWIIDSCIRLIFIFKNNKQNNFKV